jgi:hypothetical protein
MNIVFFCQSCGARFEVDARMAGKQGRCKKCGQRMSIPQAAELASMASMPALALAAAPSGPASSAAVPVGAGAAAGAPRGLSWLRAATSNVGLAPITVDRMPLAPRKATPLDDSLGDSKPYALAAPVSEWRGRATIHDNVVLRVWRQQLGHIQKLFRKLNQAAYLISIPFLMILILGAVIGNRPMAVFAAAFVVLLNIGRIVAGAANLAVVPFRDGLNFSKMKKPLGRLIEPAVTIVLVILAFTFIPWLSSGAPASGSVGDRVRSGARSLGSDIKGEVDKAVERARQVDVEKLGAQAQDRLKGFTDKARAINR